MTQLFHQLVKPMATVDTVGALVLLHSKGS